ncbi:hypothetical protein N2152v2_004214 [Parachlorella kessleri]
MKGGRECSESCMDYLLLELVHHYRTQEYGPPLAAAVEAIGLRVGRQLIERYAKDKAPLVDQLEVMKFLCKDFWSEVFRKNVDNLRTNKRGTFVLRDNHFRWLSRLSQNQVPAAVGQGPQPPLPRQELAADYLHLPCALIRGALLQLGLECTVSADASNLPQCEFTVVIKAQPR